MALRWTRIWCVRPVAIATWSSDTPAQVLRPGDARHRAPRTPGARGHLLPVAGIAADRLRRCGVPAWTRPQTSAMYSFSTSRSWNWRDELLVRGVVLGGHHHARRAAVEPVHDPRAQLAADAAQIVHMVEQRVDQRAAGMPGRRVHDHPGRLVETTTSVSSIEDGERQVLRRRRFGWTGLGSVDRERWPARTGVLARAALPGPVTWPSLISL